MARASEVQLRREKLFLRQARAIGILPCFREISLTILFSVGLELSRTRQLVAVKASRTVFLPYPGRRLRPSPSQHDLCCLNASSCSHLPRVERAEGASTHLLQIISPHALKVQTVTPRAIQVQIIPSHALASDTKGDGLRKPTLAA